ncbi:MAG: hypothetical protein JSV66_03575 [Trueperaceae bacterium]|nr:MAG: hypothetical protein JSV66_03575 [Trueperaceae bacterium]
MIPSRRLASLFFSLITAALLAGCLPQTSSDAFATPQAIEAERTATIAYHRMQIGFLETGSFSTHVLIDLQLPRGVRWTLEEFSDLDRDYRLLFTVDDLPGIAWRVTPRGIERLRLASA